MKQIDQPAIHTLFPCPVYITKRDLDLDSAEEKEIEDIIVEGPWVLSMIHGHAFLPRQNFCFFNFNTKLKKIRQFCDQQIKIYVKQVINPIEKLDFYITQSWINVLEPGAFHHKHSHDNSIISGIYYVETEKDDKIMFCDPNEKIKGMINIKKADYNIWNSTNWSISIDNNQLLLFPSWLNHMVEINAKATKNRMSISFNVFAKGIFGKKEELDELIL